MMVVMTPGTPPSPPPSDVNEATASDPSRSSAAASPGEELVRRARQVSAIAARRLAVAAPRGPSRERARQLHEHVTRYVLPRARSLDAPLLVLVLGPTGAGKSSLMNTLAGRPVSRTGVLRPTTRDAVVLASAAEAAVLRDEEGPLASIPPERLEYVGGDGTRTGLAIVDAPDIDSVEHDNRALADALVEAADLSIFVTTGTRYADRVPWEVLRRVRERGLPLLVVVNRLPVEDADARAVVEDVERLLQQAGLGGHEEGRLGIVGVREGELAPDGQALRPDTVTRILQRIDELAADRDARRAMAARSLAGALAGLGPLANAVADDLEHEAIDAEALRRIAVEAYDDELRALLDELRGGRFLREEVLRNWQAFVGADQVTRLFASGIGRVRGAITSLLRGAPAAPIALVEEETTSDVVALAAAHAAEAARRTAARWNERPGAAELIAADPTLWGTSMDLGERLEGRLHSWMSAIAQDVQVSGGPKRTLARGASVGVNAVGVAVMLATFSHTGGLTGAEVGIAAATAFLNQKLLEALFGEAAMVEMIGRARRGLEAALGETLAEDRARFERLVGSGLELRALASELRSAVAGIAG